jgi:hypothetical protein
MDRQVLDWTTVAILILAVLAVLVLSLQLYRTLKLAVARAELAEAYLAACFEPRSPRGRVRNRRDVLCTIAEEHEVSWGLRFNAGRVIRSSKKFKDLKLTCTRTRSEKCS